MGMNVAVLDHGTWRPVAHLKDTGPVAWKDVAIVVPVLEPDRMRIRLTFPADNWRIDRLAIASRFRRLPNGPVVHRLSTVLDALEHVDTAAVASISAADARYLEVASSRRFTAVFRPGVCPATVPEPSSWVAGLLHGVGTERLAARAARESNLHAVRHRTRRRHSALAGHPGYAGGAVHGDPRPRSMKTAFLLPLLGFIAACPIGPTARRLANSRTASTQTCSSWAAERAILGRAARGSRFDAARPP